jgi:hypothetical protein
MKIWAHTLVKNEGRWLWFSVTSIIDYVDKILLWDTGSSDLSLKIEHDLLALYPDKIIFKKRIQKKPEEFALVRQEMLDSTDSDWFLMLDGDEIWWKDSIEKITGVIKDEGGRIESIFVPTVNVVGDMFHHQGQLAGKYKFGKFTGHYNLRAINRNIPGLHSQGAHGVWGWADDSNKMIQDRDNSKLKFVDSPYLHTTFVQRSSDRVGDFDVAKRKLKLKYEIGETFPKDFYFPEALFVTRPDYIQTPWAVMPLGFKFKAYIETPLKYIKRKLWTGKPGY